METKTKIAIEAATERNQLDLTQLSKPFWTALVIGSISLLLFVSFLVITMDRGTLRSSEQVLYSVLEDRRKTIEGVAFEYGYWDEAVEQVVYQKNKAWIEDNFVESMLSIHDLDKVHVLDGEGNIVVNIVDGGITDETDNIPYREVLSQFSSTARVRKRASVPEPISGIFGSDDGLYLASGINMTTYNSVSDINTNHTLIISKKVDEAFLADLRSTYHLWGLEYALDKPNPFQAGLPIHDVKGKLIGQFVWSPSLAGKELLPLLTFGVIAVFVAMLLSARAYLQRATRLIYELQVARVEAETAKKKLDKIAKQDPLTGLGNRRCLMETMDRLKGENATQEARALMSIDLDGFKQVNDSFGHEIGDAVLKEFSALLKRTVGKHGETFRLGGDEFCVVFFDTQRRDIVRIGKKIIEVLSRAQKIGDVTVDYGASVGISFSQMVDSWISESDAALYSAKRNGRGKVEVFDEIVEQLDSSKAVEPLEVSA